MNLTVVLETYSVAHCRLDDVLVALCELLCRSSGEVQLPAGPADGRVLVGLELGVVVGELVIEDGDGHAVEDDAKGDAGEGKDTSQVGLWEHVAVAHSGNAHLKGHRGKPRKTKSFMNFGQIFSKMLSKIYIFYILDIYRDVGFELSTGDKPEGSSPLKSG